MANFTFDLTLLATMTVEAESQAEAETMIRNMVEDSDALIAGREVTLQIEGEMNLDEDTDNEEEDD